MEGGGNNPLSCKVCPEGTDKTKRAGFRACFCLDGYFRRDRFGKCEICPQEGLNCFGDYVRIMPGYFWDWSYTNIDKYIKFVHNLQTFDNSYEANNSFLDISLPLVHKCHQISRCVNNDSIAGKCKDGYQGWMCSACSEGLYEVFGSCHKCPEMWIFFTEIAILLLVLASFCVYVVYTHRRERPGMSRTIIDITLARSKIVLGFYQVMGEFWQSLDEFHWPERFQKIAAWLDILQFNISTILIKPSCYFPKIVLTPYVMFVIGVSVPLAILVCITLVFFIGKVISRYVAQRYPLRGQTKVRIDHVCDKALTIGVLVLFITYPSTCNAIFALYSPACDTFYLDELKTINISILRSDYSINCTTPTHSKFVTASYVASSYVVAFPFILFCLLWKYNQTTSATLWRAEEKPIPKWLRFLNENYKNRFWFWEILELLRKISQTFILILFGWSNSFTITVTLAISVVFLSLHTSYSPMKDRFEHYLQLSSLWAIFLNMLVATVPSSHVSENLTETAMSVLLIILNLLVIGIIVGKPICFLLKIIQKSRILQTSVQFMVRQYWKCRSSLFSADVLLTNDEPTGGVLQPFNQNTEHYGSIN
ncbi:hypothetical protein HOLleu_13985 [Holothuria leucospilota]|uniref:Uncharacterized protein n=1 Tax=Holothuria leucospilota TaxID=206669 RepID=A0A9Q1H8M7_HOLLE|nr:hypothetical protein HOLleu_13985 [Holothuria leucospilota]